MERSRNFQNRFAKRALAADKKDQLLRLCKNVINERFASLWRQQIRSAHDYSMYTGSLGYCFVAFRLSQIFPTESFADNALTYLDKSITLYDSKNARKHRSVDISFIMGVPGIYVMTILVLSQILKTINQDDNESRDALMSRINSSMLALLDMQELATSGSFPNELLYGTSGFLYCLELLIKNQVTGDFHDRVMSALVSVTAFIFRQGKSYSSSSSSLSSSFADRGILMYAWHNKKYLGGAHGVSGIITQLISSLSLQHHHHHHHQEEEEEEMIEWIRRTISYLSTCIRGGNYASHVPSDEVDDDDDESELYQWCHGPTGFVFLYCQAYAFFHDTEYLALARQAADMIYEFGLLKKGNGLCHGISGNAYAFLAMYRATSEVEYLDKAMRFAEFSESDEARNGQGTPDHPFSLFEGEAGKMLLFGDLWDPSHSYFPSHEL